MTTTSLPPGARVEAWPVNVPLEAPYRFALGTYRGMSRTVVRVTTADGVVGLGETGTPYEAALIAADAERVLREGAREAELRLAGDNPAERWSREEGMLLRRAYAGLELALWDVEARERAVPLYKLLGGAHRTEIPFTEYFAEREGREETPAEVAAYCARMVEEFDSPWFEGKVGLRPPDEDVRLVREIRAAIGPERSLRLDANKAWSVATAADVLGRVEPERIESIEEPVGTLAEQAELRALTATPFSSHEPDLAFAAEHRVPDAIVLNLGVCGGIAGTRRFVDACERAGVGFWWYSGDLGIATAAYLHVSAATPYLDRPSQSLFRWYPEDVIAGGPFAAHRGLVRVPDGPGLGIELDEVALARAVDRYARDGEYDLYSGTALPRY